MDIRTTYYLHKASRLLTFAVFGFVTIMLLFISFSAQAFEVPQKKPVGQKNTQQQLQAQGQIQGQAQGQKQNVATNTTVGVDTDANSSVNIGDTHIAPITESSATIQDGAVSVGGDTINAGTELSIGGAFYQDKREAPDVTFIPNNNTVSCRYVIGITGVGLKGGGGLGWPRRDKDCVYMEFATLAFSQGNMSMGWKMYCLAPTIVKELGESCLDIVQFDTIDMVMVDMQSRERLMALEEKVSSLTRTKPKAVDAPPCDTHPHKANEAGYLEYDGETYINVDKAYDPNWKANCGVD